MNNLRCEFCGHYNPAGAEACEECEFPAGRAAAAEAGETSSDYSAGPDETSDYFAGVGDAPPPPTAIPSPQFKGAGDVISPTLELYRKHFMLVGLLVLVTTLPLVLLQYSLLNVVSTGGHEGDGNGSIGVYAVARGLGGTVLYWILTTVGGALLSGALAYVVVQVQRAGAARAGESLLWGLTKLPKIVAVTFIVYLLIYCAPALVVVVMAAVLGPVAFIAFLAMLLPWIILVLTFSLAVPAAAIENRGVIESLARSLELTRGYKGLLFLTYFLWWVVIIILNVVTTWSFYYGSDGVPENSLVSTLVQMLVGGMLNSSMTVLTIYIFLGILNENRQGFEASDYAAAPGPAAH